MLQISNFIKIRPVGAELFHPEGRADRQTDMAKLVAAFRSFAKAPRNKAIHAGQNVLVSDV
jgi:hypothetical protein